MVSNIDLQYLTDKTGKRTAVIIPINEWTNICKNIAELDKHEVFKTNLQGAFKEMIEIEKGKGEKVTLNEFINEL